MAHLITPKNNMKYLVCLFVLSLFACNPIPKKDSHPEVPYLSDLLKDSSKFKKIAGADQVKEIMFLKNDRIMLIPNQSGLAFKIIDANNNVILEEVFDWKLPFYIDKEGNLYFNRQKYFFPDYKKHEDFKTVVIQDSLTAKSAALQNLNDSLSTKAIEEYNIKLQARYGLEPCENIPLKSGNCDVFEIINGALVVRQPDLFKNDFAKVAEEVAKFDDDILIRWDNGKLPNPVYLSYYQMQNQKFKCNAMTFPKLIGLSGKSYLYAANVGLYQLRN
ncbi:hypothetical protein [Pedobacter psychrodurus]|uniref:hypothetical protein n=1 Tax=Pedobacter psychrodurus TaxID=2530456 RepID=UPI002930B242|nr:hypothetical protein [Pedobacter psychrodurus]